MGKIRVSTLGSANEEELREKQKVKREEKKKRESAGKSEKVHISGMKGGQRVKSVGAQSEEEIEKMAKLAEEVEKDQAEGIEVADKGKPSKKKKVRSRGKRYKEALIKVDHGKLYKIDEALPLLREISLTKLPGSVELHINTVEKGLRGTVSLPHGTGKEIRVVIADNTTIDKIVAEVESGKIDFDALIAHPSVMAKLAKVAKFLGPKGLMPNPKAGTISPEPEKVAAKIKGGEIAWKTESDFPIIHQVIGKLSFKDKQLEENLNALIKTIGATKIRSITLKSTMSPGIKIQFS
jgi:large subunit ribosomal protein L1